MKNPIRYIILTTQGTRPYVFSRILKITKLGWTIRPTSKSEMARQVSSRLEGVCKEYFLKMTNTIKKFAVTAKGDKTALIIPVIRLLVLRCSILSNSASGRWKQELPSGDTVKVAVVVVLKLSISFKPGAASNASPTHFAYWTLK